MYQKIANKKIIATVLGMLFLVASIGVGLVLNQQERKTKVGAAGVNLSLSANNPTPKVNDTITVAVAMDTQGMKVTGLDLKIKYDTTKLTATSIEKGNLLTNVFIPGSITSGTANIVLGCPIDNTGPHPVSGSGLVAVITFAVKAAGTSSVVIDPSTIVSVSGQTINMLGNVTPVQITTATATTTPTATKTPSPIPTKTPSPKPTATKTPSPTPIRSSTPIPQVCGGIQGLGCPTGKVCVYSNGTTQPPYPDATGTCQNQPSPKPTPTRSPIPPPKLTPSPSPKPTATKTPSPVPTGTPGPKTTLSLNGNPTCNTIPLKWVSLTGAKGYYLDISNTSSFSNFSSSGRLTNTTTQFTFNNLNVNTTYYARITLADIPGFPQYAYLSNIKTAVICGSGTPSPLPTKSPSPRPTATGTHIAGDVDGNGIVNIVDIGIAVDNFATTPLLDTRPDLDNNGIVNIVDIGIIIDNYAF